MWWRIALEAYSAMISSRDITRREKDLLFVITTFLDGQIHTFTRVALSLLPDLGQ